MWQTTSLPYPGIKFTHQISMLYKANYLALFHRLLEDARTWSDAALSWMGRVASMKMMVLPKLLYYFRTLPISVPIEALRLFQTKIFNFIWGTKDSRLARTTMYAPKDLGGLGVPDVRKYYIAAQLTQLCQLRHNHYRPDWVSIEAQACSPLPIYLILWLPSKYRKAILCSSLSHLVSLWESTSRKWPICSPHSPVVPFFNNPQFLPGIAPVLFRWWIDGGLYSIGHFLDHRVIWSSSYFAQDLDMPSSENFHIQQIYNFYVLYAREVLI